MEYKMETTIHTHIYIYIYVYNTYGFSLRDAGCASHLGLIEESSRACCLMRGLNPST